jgi:chromosome segregation ATPase
MDNSRSENCSTTNWRAELARSLDEQRSSARALLSGQRERFKSLESQLAGRIDELIATVSAEQLEGSQHEEDVARREIVLAKRDSDLASRLQELAQRETQWSLGLRQSQEKQQQWLGELADKIAVLDAKQMELLERESRLQSQQAALAQRETELDRQSQELVERTEQLELTVQQAAERQQALDQSRDKLREESEQLQAKLTEWKRVQAEVECERETLKQRELDTQKQRRHIAQQLRARKNELVAEVELHRAEALCSSHGEELQLQIRLSELQAKYDRVREELDDRDVQRGSLGEKVGCLQQQLQDRDSELESRSTMVAAAEAARDKLVEKVDEVTAEIAAAKELFETERAKIRDELNATFESQQKKLIAKLTDLREQRDLLQTELNTARESAAQASASTGLEIDLAGEVERLHDENNALKQRLVEAEASSGGSSDQESEALEDLRNRLEMAVQDVRDLKNKNADLNDRLTKANRVAASSGHSAESPALGWEAQKQRLLQQLEDFDEGDEQQHAERLKVEHAIRVTDQMVAEKQQEIEELRQLLQNQSDNIGSVAVGAAAIASMLDSDELIRQERENVKGLQQELEAKLRKAEVDISLERAKLARERAEMEEKLQVLERERAQLTSAHGGGGSDQASKGGTQPTRGRWLARLGIQGDDGKK